MRKSKPLTSSTITQRGSHDRTTYTRCNNAYRHGANTSASRPWNPAGSSYGRRAGPTRNKRIAARTKRCRRTTCPTTCGRSSAMGGSCREPTSLCAQRSGHANSLVSVVSPDREALMGTVISEPPCRRVPGRSLGRRPQLSSQNQWFSHQAFQFHSRKKPS
jgi:hypothetical protein